MKNAYFQRGTWKNVSILWRKKMLCTKRIYFQDTSDIIWVDVEEFAEKALSVKKLIPAQDGWFLHFSDLSSFLCVYIYTHARCESYTYVVSPRKNEIWKISHSSENSNVPSIFYFVKQVNTYEMASWWSTFDECAKSTGIWFET